MKFEIVTKTSTVDVRFSAPVHLVYGLYHFLPQWVKVFTVFRENCHVLIVSIPVASLNEHLPYGHSPDNYVFDCFSQALGDSVHSRYASAY